MTPQSLDGSPSSAPPLGGATPGFGPHPLFSANTTLDSLSPTSPPSGSEVGGGPPGGGGGASSGGAATPSRKTSTPRPDRVFTCKVCSRSFGYKHVLQNHERTHTGEKPFECKECQKRFTRDHHLKTHMRLHTGEKPYHCTHCDRQFVQVANLRRHLRVHTGERPYTCETCASKFSDSNQLKAHLLIHKGEKPFECPRCLGKFRRRHHLIHHKCPRDPSALRSLRDALAPFADTDAFFVDRMFPKDEDMMDEEDPLLEEARARSPPAETTVLTDDEPLHAEKRRERKSREPRRVVLNPLPAGGQTPPPASLLAPHLPPTPLPEQTEPEDLSVSGSRRSHTYRANIALATASPDYPRYPLQYPSPEHAHHRDIKGEVMGYENGGTPPLSSAL
ncbi:UNVERIFIED_CONTAM: hypothetical protein GTU68_020250 [Idotea baltica]|nr:hypothetical protein [Idotea baltica]